MTGVFILNYYAAHQVDKEASQPELIGVFSDYGKAWTALENHAKQFQDSKLDLSAADMGAILLDDGKSEEWTMGGYSLNEETLDEVLA